MPAPITTTSDEWIVTLSGGWKTRASNEEWKYIRAGLEPEGVYVRNSKGVHRYNEPC